jgi:LysM repeat protein
MKKINQIAFLMLIIFSLISCDSSAQPEPELNSKDDPAMLLDSALNVLMTDTVVTDGAVAAFTFQSGEGGDLRKTTIDTVAGLKGFKVLKKISRLDERDVETLLGILTNSMSYDTSDMTNKCGFQPDLAFRFTNKTDTLSILIMSKKDCNNIQFYYNNTDTVYQECTLLGRSGFVSLAKVLFPREYVNIPVELTTETPEIPEDATENEEVTEDNNTETNNAETSVTEERNSANNTHTVQRDGKTLQDIAGYERIGKSEILDLNEGINWKTPLKKGQKIVIKKSEE